jgi:hypothetical protein
MTLPLLETTTLTLRMDGNYCRRARRAPGCWPMVLAIQSKSC